MAQVDDKLLAELLDLKTNVEYLLSRCPYTVRDMSGDMTGQRGVEYLAGSLAITFLGMEDKIRQQ